MSIRYKRLRGMADLLPEHTPIWQQLEQAVHQVMQAYHYGEIRTPVIEPTDLFVRSIGEATDIVEKEMYTFSSRSGDARLSLRPENTASCVRAAIENGLLQPGSVHRLWYQGPMFRYERPQLGRQRQFHQTGAEVYGLAGPDIEAELIMLGQRLWQALGIDSAVRLEINSLGEPDDRARYRATLVEYFNDHLDQLDEDSVRRLERNPLRILDSKNPDMQSLLSGAPQLRESLSDASLEHADSLQSLLAAQHIEVINNPRLVRGLDYYSHTVFEWTTDRLGSQSAICAGGRYDGLLEQLGARATPGVGWAFGMERVVALMQALDVSVASHTPDVFIISTSDAPASAGLTLAEHVRNSVPGVSVLQNTARGSMKSQFRKADKSGAPVALLIGADEAREGTVTVKPLIHDLADFEQQTVPAKQLDTILRPMLDTLTADAS